MVTPTSPSDETAKPPLNLDELRSFLVQLDNTFHTRVNILLLAQSLFLAALSQVWSSGGIAINFAFCVLAVAITKLLWEPLRILADRTKDVARKLDDDPIYQLYIPASQKKREQTYRLANWVPKTFIVCWLVIAVMAILRHFKLINENLFKW